MALRLANEKMPMRQPYSSLLSEDAFVSMTNKLDSRADSKEKRARTCYRFLEKEKLFNPDKLIQFYKEKKHNNLSKPLRRSLLDYLLYNIVEDKIVPEKGIIKEFVYQCIFYQRKKVLIYWYNKKKPNNFPLIEGITESVNIIFISMLVFTYRLEDINEDVIIQEFFSCFKNLLTTVVFKEFSALLYPSFVLLGLMEKRDNCIDYLNKRWKGIYVTEEENLWNFFNNKMSSYRETDFYFVLKGHIEDCINKSKYKGGIETLKKYIIAFSNLVDFCIKNNVYQISGINANIRDGYISENINQKKVIDEFSLIRQTFKYYISNFKKEFDLSLFSKAVVPKKPVDIAHIGFLNTAVHAMVASVFDEIKKSRLKPFETLTSFEQLNFFLDRVIWLLFLTGSRVSEVRSLDLDEVERSLDYKNPYFYIRTLKGNNNREFMVERGEELDDGSREMDFIHFDILKETIVNARFLYKGHDIKNKHLFPNRILEKVSASAIYRRLQAILVKNGIVYGSEYDIISRTMYESSPELRKKYGKAIFYPHKLRSINMNLLLFYGKLNRHELAEAIGHRNKTSQYPYTRNVIDLVTVTKLMESNDHFGARNQLVDPSTHSIHCDPELARENVFIKDVSSHFNSLDLTGMTVNEAESYLDKHTTCDDISCSAKGMDCLICEHFEAGIVDPVKLMAVDVIIKQECISIDQDIKFLNSNKDVIKDPLLLSNCFRTLLQRFDNIEIARVKVLVKEFGLSEANSKKRVHSIIRSARKNDINKKVRDKVKSIYEVNKEYFNGVDLGWYRTMENKKIYR